MVYDEESVKAVDLGILKVRTLPGLIYTPRSVVSSKNNRSLDLLFRTSEQRPLRRVCFYIIRQTKLTFTFGIAESACDSAD
jgi:hypothetical protein